jgi:transcriptional regulator GlxA family with amidase domain
MAENVGDPSLRTDASSAIIVRMARARPASAARSTPDASRAAGRPAPPSRRSQRNVVVLLFDGVQSLDVSGPVEVLAAVRRVPASSERSLRGYDIRTLSVDRAAVRTSSGLTIVPDGSLDDAHDSIDTLIVPGGAGARAASADPLLLGWVSDTSARSRRTVSVCTGAFVLAAAGLLDGRRATTHWTAAAALARLHPRVDVDPDPIFVRDGDVWTSAGVTAGMDLALALVEDDHDRDLALTIARHLVLFLRRPGGQSQFSATLAAQEPAREPLRDVQRAVLDDVARDHSVEAMAARAHMSPRHFARAFRAETGVTPARYVERVRLDAARRALEDTTDPIAAIAAASGFGTAETMRRAFIRALAVAPAEYRRRFQSGEIRRPPGAPVRPRAAPGRPRAAPARPGNKPDRPRARRPAVNKERVT